MGRSEEGAKKLRAASYSILVNAFLIAIKIIVALVTGSLAVMAELFHSLFDITASVFAYFGIKKAGEPADKTHLYGHEKFENLSSLAQTILIVLTSLFIIYEAVRRIGSPKNVEYAELGFLVMVITIVIDYFVSGYLHRTSKQHGSTALEADAYHFTTDLWGAMAVIVGLFFVHMGFPVFDSIAALAVAFMMFYVSYGLGKRSLYVLIDKSPPDDVMNKIRSVASSVKGVAYFHRLKARQAGNRIFVEFDMHVSSDMTIREAHALSHQVKKKLIKEIPAIKDVTIHVEPDSSKN